MCTEYMLLSWCAKSASWVTCKPIVCLLAFLPHACCLALLQYVTCINPFGKLADSGSRPPLCPSCVVCSHHACCLPDTKTVCVSSSPVLTAKCWKMHVMCQVTLQSSLSLLALNKLTIQSASLRCKIIVYKSGIELHQKVAGKKIPPRRSPCSQRKRRRMITARFLNGIK